MATTTNYGWETPDNTDLVRDGAEAIRDLGEAIDNTVYLNSELGGGALTLISATTIGTAVSSVTVSGAFSATFDNYQIVISGGVASANAELSLKLGATVTGYYAARNRVTYGGNTSVQTDNNAGSFGAVVFTSTNAIAGNFYLNNPFLAKNTFFSALVSDPEPTGRSFYNGGYLDNSISYTNFTISMVGPTLTGGTIRVYGFQNL